MCVYSLQNALLLLLAKLSCYQISQFADEFICAGILTIDNCNLILYVSARHHQHDFDNEHNYTQSQTTNYRQRLYGNAFHPGRIFQGRTTDPGYRRYPGAFGPANRNSYLLHAENVPQKPKVVTIVRNGPKPRSNVKILLNRRSVQSFEQLMGDISEAFGPKWKNNKVRKLFTTRGREVQGISDFFREDDIFVAVGNDQLTEHDVLDIIEEIYPESPYAKNIMRDFDKQKRKRMAIAGQNKDADPDKRDSGFGEGSDGSNKDVDQDIIIYKGRPTEKGKRRNEYPRDMEVAMRLDREKEKAAQEEKDRARKQKLKMMDAERRALEDESRKRRLIPLKNQQEDPFRRMREQKEKEREEIRRRREEERQRHEEEERQRKEKEQQEREQAEKAARERQAAAEKERMEKEKEKAERRAAREKEREMREREKEMAREKEREKQKEQKEKEHKEHIIHIDNKEKEQKDNKERIKEKENKDTKDAKESENEKADKGKEAEKDIEDKKVDKNDNAKDIVKDNREVEKEREKEKERDRERRKKKSKSKIVRKTKLERQISSDDYVLAKYELGRTLGDGNFAVVRIGKMKATGMEYAMKVIDKPKLKGKEHMVENEIEIMKDCNHPNIVKLYEEYETADKIYLVMELVKVGCIFNLYEASSRKLHFSKYAEQ